MLVLEFLLGLVLTVVAMPTVIKKLKQSKEQAVIRVLGPDHQAKAGTPSLGGAVFGIVTLAIVFFLPSTYENSHSLTTVLALAVGFGSYGVIGAVDDILKLVRHADDGFAFKPKLFAQTVSALVVMLLLWAMHVPAAINLPVVGVVELGFFYIIFLWFWLVGWSNATNLTDGLDGLLTGLSLIAYGTYTLMAIRVENWAMVSFNVVLIGALVGFLLFNKPKAKIFMGDTGSLALGAGLAVESIQLHAVISLLIIGLVFVIETLSVIIQTISYHFFKVRVFPMAPIHHSFEKFGWSEWQIDIVFWLFGLLCAAISLWIF
ncbi:phospho-N-acetylmuramoyl-pentapeptide-transferase [Fructobacillus sp. M1-13]|uniref:Phospho-N-acetylmuramoyl-pentapeptide-transferase n=1 Tax=Fructobacillus papyriferae TaxID=2713171 RepID=A0ABS5QQ22_9LACO|nr:phospho-N-acetylmuramoyl-pentapeptide-transferase [Fructobacillus papyriferae]MBS9334501.1 phospho-N-acetylmuramoyl-pentapeptide-transferase [Fructobacillus papyriferae]MCD2158490.1 phospho-N-acetylmuramoyl-pentapeptide-transferase [Fructobacillus papyriferae]